jgi:hypothetical protein
VRRIALPGPARSAAHLDAQGVVHVIVEQDARQALCRLRAGAQARCIGLGVRADQRLADAPLVTAGGTALAPFVDDCSPILPRLHGVLALRPDGPLQRWPLPEGEAAAGSTDSPQLRPSGTSALLATVPGQPALFLFENL